MLMTEEHFHAILRELIDENPIACRGILRIARLVFTETVPTLAVTLEHAPELRVNLSFVAENCQTEAHVKAVIMHEFLHVLLNHTERFTELDTAQNLAFDIVINAIIHRVLGPSYSDMMARYYARAEGVARLLRPMIATDDATTPVELRTIWRAVYTGELVVDDLLELVDGIAGRVIVLGAGRGLLGSHDGGGRTPLPPEVEAALRDTLRSLNGGGIWRAPRDHGVGGHPYQTVVSTKRERILRWERTAWEALRQCLLPDRRASAGTPAPQVMQLPILNEHDRRAFLRATWSPIIPDASWTTQRRVPGATAQLYLDVSGSMEAEMRALLALLIHFRRHIRSPFWAFSTVVVPAVIEDGQLRTSTSGGTSINSVLDHVARTRPGRALVITDGYIEPCDRRLLQRTKGQQIHAIVSRDGSTAELERAGIPCVQLERRPV